MSCRAALFSLAIIAAFAGDNMAAGALPSANARRMFGTVLAVPPGAGAGGEKAALLRIADTPPPPDGVRLTTLWPTPTMNQGNTIINTLEVTRAVAGQKIRIQNSNHGASIFTTGFSAAIEAAIAAVPGVTCAPVNAQQVEITLAAGSYTIPITQTVTRQPVSGHIDDAPWAAGEQLQTDWLLSRAPSNGAPVEREFAVISKWISYTRQGAASDARWSLLRSVPNIGSGSTVRFEIDMTNYTLTSSVTLHIGVDGASTARGADFARDLNASIAAALNPNVAFEPQTGILSFGPQTVFPFSFTMTAGAIGANKDYVLGISDSQVGQIDVAQAGVWLGTTVALPPTAPLLGLNEASGEFGVGNYNFKYSYPGKDRFDWAAEQGFGMIRVPFLFQNIQASSGSPLNEAAMRQLDPVLSECAAKHIVCLLDMHNYGSYYLDDTAAAQGLPGTIDASNARLANLWGQIARRYKDNGYVWFDLMNEPHQQTALEWVKTDNAIAAAIRATGATNKIIFQGTAWEGAWTWETSGNATQMLKAYDPGHNNAFEAHQYLDADGSGTSPVCVTGSGATRLDPFTRWLQTNGLQGILGEIGWADNAGCTTEATALLGHWQAAAASPARGGYIGLTYWAAGPWWSDNYMYLAEPRPFPAGASPAQLKTLRNYLPR